MAYCFIADYTGGKIIKIFIIIFNFFVLLYRILFTVIYIINQYGWQGVKWYYIWQQHKNFYFTYIRDDYYVLEDKYVETPPWWIRLCRVIIGTILIIFALYVLGLNFENLINFKESTQEFSDFNLGLFV